MAEWQDEPAPAGSRQWHGRMLVLVDGATRSSGESSTLMLRAGLGARVAGTRTAGMIEYGNIVPYLLPHAGLHIALPTKHNDFGEPVEMVGFPVDVELDPTMPLDAVADRFDAIHGTA
jgi:C-terminal processing protease CtpA/Prc